MALIQHILVSGEDVLADEYTMQFFSGDDLLAACRPRGLPIGNLTSQFWSNCYLHPLDLFVKRELGCRAYPNLADSASGETQAIDFQRWRPRRSALHEGGGLGLCGGDLGRWLSG
jgi:hypothetical protein